MPSFDLSISPAQLEFILKPGGTLTQAYEVENNAKNDLYLTASVRPWLPTGTDGSVTFDNVPDNPRLHFSLVNADLKLNQTFLLKPGQKRQLVLKLQSDPETPLSDGYYSFFISQDLSSQMTDTSAASAEIGSNLLITVSKTDNLPAKARIIGFSASPRLKDAFFTPVSFSGRVSNLTSYYFRPEGKIIVTKGSQTIKEITLDPQNVLGSFARTIQCPDGCVLSPPLWPGVYTATLRLDPAVNAKEASLTFFVFPYYLTLFLLLLGLAIFALLRTLRRHTPDL